MIFKNGKYYKPDKLLTLKDEKLNHLALAENINIAQFISFSPEKGLTPEFIHIRDFDRNELELKKLIKLLITKSSTDSVNIRSFSISKMKGNKLIVGKTIKDIDEVIRIVKENIQNDKNTIINENIDIFDSGVSGVCFGDLVEFSPEDTPKCVDKEGVCSLPKHIALKVLEVVYGFKPELIFDEDYRIEFSMHPHRQGLKKGHTIIWEYEHYIDSYCEKKIRWPNRFSKFIGDKTFGLLIAYALDLPVPYTTVISRKIPPFSFGKKTGMHEKVVRTCPISKEPGKFYTGFSWVDPFKLVDNEEKNSEDISIASILSQDYVEPLFSGASFIYSNQDHDIIEGVKGRGDKFMIGESDIENLPIEAIEKIRQLNNLIRTYNNILGNVSVEWVYDGIKVWIVQINQLKNDVWCDIEDERITIVNGNPIRYEKVYVSDGLDSLRDKIKYVKDNELGIELIGNIGITSHFGDLLRLANIPSVLKRL